MKGKYTNISNQKKISIIIPVYNVEGYIRNCLNSLTGQSFEKLEIIVVDDGSTDESGRICDEYAGRDARIKVRHKENRGVSAARNDGLDNAEGEYIFFVDSDDFLERSCLEKLVCIIEESGADIVQCGVRKVKEDKTEQAVMDAGEAVFSKPKYTVYSRDRMNRIMHIENSQEALYVWNKLYRAELFENLRFINGVWHEDVYMSYKTIDKASTTAVTEEKLYYYLQRKSGFMRGGYDTRKLDIIKVYKSMSEHFKGRDLELADAALLKYIRSIKRGMREVLDFELEDEGELFDELKTEYRKAFGEVISRSSISIAEKFKAYIFKIAPKVWVKMISFKIRMKKIFEKK